jgi:hypothetical protein
LQSRNDRFKPFTSTIGILLTFAFKKWSSFNFYSWLACSRIREPGAFLPLSLLRQSNLIIIFWVNRDVHSEAPFPSIWSGSSDPCGREGRKPPA